MDFIWALALDQKSSVSLMQVQYNFEEYEKQRI